MTTLIKLMINCEKRCIFAAKKNHKKVGVLVTNQTSLLPYAYGQD